mmetsp:Transcript_88771/g.123218  ORF Transcript_88771/g.123218 Transcript_88771/m.123218 type:complete len:85 (+) Transcript_88771:51-305(+)
MSVVLHSPSASQYEQHGAEAQSGVAPLNGAPGAVEHWLDASGVSDVPHCPAGDGVGGDAGGIVHDVPGHVLKYMSVLWAQLLRF